jgi:hypothetical protein
MPRGGRQAALLDDGEQHGHGVESVHCQPSGK